MTLPIWVKNFEGVTRVEKVFFQTWWVFLSILICLIVYEKSIYERNSEYIFLDAQLKNLQQEKQNLQDEQENLRIKLASRSDPAWIELTLMKILGVVPEGYRKYYFSD